MTPDPCRNKEFNSLLKEFYDIRVSEIPYSHFLIDIQQSLEQIKRKSGHHCKEYAKNKIRSVWEKMCFGKTQLSVQVSVFRRLFVSTETEVPPTSPTWTTQRGLVLEPGSTRTT